MRRSAYYQLVLHPILALGNLHEMYYAVAKNLTLAEAGNPSANHFADEAERLYARDAELTRRYHAMEGGKWNHMMSQTHIGYTGWQQPEEQVMPAVLQSRSERSRSSRRTIVRPVSIPEKPGQAIGSAEQDHFVSKDATSYDRAIDTDGVAWVELKGHGRTGVCHDHDPRNRPRHRLSVRALCWSTRSGLKHGGPVVVDAYLSPTQDYYGGDDHGIRFGVSLDGGQPIAVDMHADRSTNERNFGPWRRRVADAIHIASTPPLEATTGKHVLRFWRIDAGAVLQKLVVRNGEVPASYLGPPESLPED